MSELADPFDRERRGKAMGRLRALAKRTARGTTVPETVLVGREPAEHRVVLREGIFGFGRKIQTSVELAERQWRPGGWRLHGMTLEDREAFQGRPGKSGTRFLYDAYVSREVWLNRSGQLEICDIEFRRDAGVTSPTTGRRGVRYVSDPRPAGIGGLIWFEKHFQTGERWQGDTKVSFQNQKQFNWAVETPFGFTFRAVQNLAEGHAVDNPSDAQFNWLGSR